MRPVMAFVDERALARSYKTGDVVQKTGLRDLLPAPYLGRVLFSNTDTGVVVVQWPWGAEQEYPSTLNPVMGKEVGGLLDLNQWQSNWDSAKHGMYDDDSDRDNPELSAKIASKFEKSTMPLWRQACKNMYLGLDDVESFQKLSREFGDEFGSDVIRRTISNLTESAKRMSVYWHDSKRRYRVTQKERKSGKFTCPRCKSPLKPRIFRQNQKVLACKSCGFTIHPLDII